jgi:alpha-tubulin suppressor-like RCC1 family protein
MRATKRILASLLAVWLCGCGGDDPAGAGGSPGAAGAGGTAGVAASGGGAGGGGAGASVDAAAGGDDGGGAGAGGGGATDGPAVVPGVDSAAPSSGTPPLQIAEGGHQLFLRSDGTVWGRGRYDQGQLGDGTPPVPGGDPNRTHTNAVAVVGLPGVRSIHITKSTSFAVAQDGGLWVWGASCARFSPNDSYYGNGPAEVASGVPVQTKDLTDVVEVAANAQYVLVRKGTGAVWGWGNTITGQLGGLGGPVGQPRPVEVPGLTGVTALAAGATHAMALTADKKVFTWGDNDAGALGRGPTLKPYPNPPAPVPGLDNVVAIAAAGFRSYAIKADGTLWAWGFNEMNQLGLGMGANFRTDVPIQVPGIANVRAIACADFHVIALTADGNVWAWGRGVDPFRGGAPGDGSVPTQVPGLSDVQKIFAGGLTSYAIKTDGSVWAWGTNEIAQIKEPAGSAAPTPTQVIGRF